MKQFFKFFIVFLFFFSTNFSQASDLLTAIENNRNDNKIAELIDDETINLNAQDLQGRTALVRLTFCGKFNLTKKLLQHNVDVNIGTKNNETALYYACCNWPQPNLDLIKLLVKRKANVNAATINYKLTPLMRIIYREQLGHQEQENPEPQPIEEYTEIIHLLLDAGADTTLKNNEGKTVFDMASPEVLKILNQRTQQAQRERDAATCNMKLLNPAQANQPYRCNAMVLERTLQFLGTSNYPVK